MNSLKLIKLALFSILSITAFAQSATPDLSLAQASHHWQVALVNQAFRQGLDAESTILIRQVVLKLGFRCALAT